MRIIYPNELGGWIVITPSGEASIQTVVEKDVPPGTSYEVVEDDDLRLSQPTMVYPKRIAKNVIWERSTDLEAIVMRQMLDAQPIRVQEIYAGATFISTDHELFTLLNGAITEAFGATRAAQLLSSAE